VGVQATGYNGPAGGFGGALSGTTAFDTTGFLTYCIELEEHFGFSTTPMTGYTVQEGASYFARRHADASIADRLGQLLTWVSDHPAMVDTAAESASLQLAIWNLVYDTDFSVTTAGVFRDNSARRIQADALLAGAASLTSSRYAVYTLEAAGTQDFLLFKAKTGFENRHEHVHSRTRRPGPGGGSPGRPGPGAPQPARLKAFAFRLGVAAARRLRCPAAQRA
jgi:hypothetical protein